MEDLANNCLEPGADMPAFAKPLIGFCAGNDHIFEFFKSDIGEFYWTPKEAFQAAYPGAEVTADKLSVIAWVLPQTKETRIAHREAKNLPSIEWSKSRHYGELVNENLRRYVVDQFIDEGCQACAPILLPAWSRASSLKYGFASSWSERHAAYACGLGTFGVSDGLITPAGKAIRVGSVVVRKKLEVTVREVKTHNAWCLFHATGKCLVCSRRCPAGAISESGHDKVKCKEYIRNVTALYVEKEQLGFRVNSCGLCQTKVPCEARNPVARLVKNQ